MTCHHGKLDACAVCEEIAALTAERDAALKDAEKCYEWCAAISRYGTENKGEAMLAIIHEMQVFHAKRIAMKKEQTDAH